MTNKFLLPSKIRTYLKRLQVQYESPGFHVHLEIISSARFFVREDSFEDYGFNDNTVGHTVLFFLPLSVLRKHKIDLGEESNYRETIKTDLNECAHDVRNEFFDEVSFSVEEDSDPEYQKSFTLAGRTPIDPDTLSIWRPDRIRLFISHRDRHKAAARKLADALEPYGISAFVAHDTIEPMSTWQEEIIKGLETMEVMLAFITDDFHDSSWTNQEVGFAHARNIPVVSLKLQAKDPEGFISNQQALRGDLNKPTMSIPELYKVLAEKLDNKGRLQGALITAFVESSSFVETIERFNRLDEVANDISEDEVLRIIDGFAKNDQLHGCGYLNSHLCNFLKRRTGRDYVIAGKHISILEEKPDDEIPF